MNTDIKRAIKRLQEISKKNEEAKEYSLGDVLLLQRFEKELKDIGYTQEELERLSPSYYVA